MNFIFVQCIEIQLIQCVLYPVEGSSVLYIAGDIIYNKYWQLNMVDKQTAILSKAFLKNFLSNSRNSLSAEKVMVLVIVCSVVIRKQNWIIKTSNFMVFL